MSLYGEYKTHIRALMADYGRRGLLVGGVPIKFLPATKDSDAEVGIILAREPALVFRDGAKLKLYERIAIIANEISRVEYSYHYERPGGYFFRYEREETTDLIRKPEYHMHAVLNLPHFNAPPVNLEIMLQLIVANFYSQDLYSKQIVGQEINLMV